MQRFFKPVQKAAAVLLEAKECLRFIKIFIDLQAAIRALGNPRIKSKKVNEAVNALEALANKHD